jgi:hypothetical protein
MIFPFFILLFCCFLSLSDSQSIGETIGFQIHSYDDVAEWPSVFAKGAAHLKIDPQFRTHAFCRNQTRDRTQDKRGCFVLNHDDAGGRNDYNTGDDVVAFFNDSSNAPILASSVLVQFALCFKYVESKPLCDNADWLGLADTWLTALLNVIKTRGLNLELVLDGSASPDAHRKCLWNRWRPLNVTWTLPGDPPGAFFDNNVTEAHDRYQILNVPAYEGPVTTQAWRLAALAGFGKFAQQTQYDFQVWEPSNASNIASVLSIYTSTKILHRNMRMAINIDPVQFQLAAAPVSGTATASVVAAMPTATDSRVSLAAIDHRLVMFRVSASPPSVAMLVLDDTKTPYQFATPAAATTLPLAIGELRGVGCVGGYCWLADNQSFAIVAPLSAQPVVASGALPSPAAVSSSSAFESPKGSAVVVRARSDASCALALQLFDFGQATFNVVFDLCVYPKFAAGFTAASLAVAATFDDLSALSLTALVAIGDTNTVIRYTTVKIGYQQSASAWVVDGSSLGALSPAGVGSTPSVAIAYSRATNQTIAILVHNDAYAWNCEARTTSARHRRSVSRRQSAHPV